MEKLDSSLTLKVYNSDGRTANSLAANQTIGQGSQATVEVDMTPSALYTHIGGPSNAANGGQFAILLNATNATNWDASKLAATIDPAFKGTCQQYTGVSPNFDAGKREENASKAISEGQPANPETRAASSVGCLLVGGRRSAVQAAGATIPNDKIGCGGSSLRHPSNHQQRSFTKDEAGLHLRAVRKRGVPAVLPTALEGFHRPAPRSRL